MRALLMCCQFVKSSRLESREHVIGALIHVKSRVDRIYVSDYVDLHVTFVYVMVD